MIIENTDQLFYYLQNASLTPDQFNQVVSMAAGCYVDTTLTKDEMINSVKRYLDQWKDTPHQDRPLFAF
jgi:hypothetical protein